MFKISPEDKLQYLLGEFHNVKQSLEAHATKMLSVANVKRAKAVALLDEAATHEDIAKKASKISQNIGDLLEV
jgi:hypothetical protein